MTIFEKLQAQLDRNNLRSAKKIFWRFSQNLRRYKYVFKHNVTQVTDDWISLLMRLGDSLATVASVRNLVYGCPAGTGATGHAVRLYMRRAEK